MKLYRIIFLSTLLALLPLTNLQATDRDRLAPTPPMGWMTWNMYAGPGHWNDMDMLVVGLEGKGGPSSDLGGKGCSYVEYQSQMSMWAMLASPLAMSHDILNTSEEARKILLNREIIAIDQDPLGIAAKQVLTQSGCDIYMRQLTNNRTAVAILNATDKETHIKLAFSSLGLKSVTIQFRPYFP